MERFKSIKNIGLRRKLDVSGICRCCGLEQEDKYPILGQNPFSAEDEIEFSVKVAKLTGIAVRKTDKMPQSMCLMCIEKINDFYEFRLMAENTEKQTREALGLSEFVPESLPAPIPIRAPSPRRPVETKPLEVRLFDLKYSIEDKKLIERALSRHNMIQDCIPSTSKKRVETLTSGSQPPMKKSKKEMSCLICRDTHFSYMSDLNDHLTKEHIPLIAKYGCGSCRETFQQLSDLKAHDSMHQQQKLPYTCYVCLLSFAKQTQFNKHVTSCPLKEKLLVTVEDIKCFQCKKKFLTQNLFEWHACFLRTRGSCSKCGQHFQKKKVLFKHYVLCDGFFVTPESARDPNMKFKSEAGNANSPVRVSTPGSKAGKGPKKKTVPQRKNANLHPSIVKSELQLETLPPNEEDDEYANYEEDITYDNFGNDSDSDDGSHPALEPVVEMQEGNSASNSPIKVKLEKMNETLTVQQSTSAEIIRNIKSEKGSGSAVVTTMQQDNRLILKIKAEKGASGKQATQVLNPMALGAKNKVFKMPQGLAMKIKLEKKDAGYGDTVVEERDEAEPEDGENLMADETEASTIINIKKEKIDPAFEVQAEKIVKSKLINPLALIRREKSPTTNGIPENSLVISAVTSINPDSPPPDDNLSKQNEIETNPSETSEAKKTNEACEHEMNNLTSMVQIPVECLKLNQENHSSQLAADSDEVSQIPAANEAEIMTGIEPMDTADDLEALLRKYEGESQTTEVSNNDLLEDLLKFD